MASGDVRTVIMPLDTSEHSKRAFDWYDENLKQDNDVLILIHIVEPQYATSAISISDTVTFKLDDMNTKMDTASKKARDLMQKYLKLAEDRGINAKGMINVDNKAGEAIVKAAKANNVSLVVIGNRGIGAIRRTILGSTSDFILHHINVPVAIVPPPK